MRYPGGKNNSGSYQQIISSMPVHHEYIEGFYGSGAVFRFKRPALHSVLIDRDSTVLPAPAPGLDVVCGDCLAYLQSRSYAGSELIYLDPPYLFSARRSENKGIYKFEFGTEEEHKRLLDLAKSIKANIMILGYMSPLYLSMLKGWRVKSWQVQTRQGIALEFLWMNFSEPGILHDARYVGQTFTERQRLRRLIGTEKRS